MTFSVTVSRWPLIMRVDVEVETEDIPFPPPKLEEETVVEEKLPPPPRSPLPPMEFIIIICWFILPIPEGCPEKKGSSKRLEPIPPKRPMLPPRPPPKKGDGDEKKGSSKGEDRRPAMRWRPTGSRPPNSR